MDETVTMSRENYDELHRAYQEKIKTASQRLRESNELRETQVKNGKLYFEALERVAMALHKEAWEARQADTPIEAYSASPLDYRAVMADAHTNLDAVLAAGLRALWSK